MENTAEITLQERKEDAPADQVNTHYIAPSLMWRTFTRESNLFYYGVRIGYLSFNQKMNNGGETLFSFSNGGVGSTFDIGYDIRMRGNSFFGFKLMFTGGYIDTGMKDAAGKKMMESLSAIDLSAGLRF